MIMRCKKNLKLWLFMLAITMGAWTATAIPIDGGLSFAGGFGANNPNLTIATSVTSFSNVDVTSASGTFAAEGVSPGDGVNLNVPIVFDPLPGSWTNPLWSVGGFSFAIESIEDVGQESFMGATLLEIKALGTISHAGYDDTPGVFLFTGNSARGTLSFSASNLADAPPDEPPPPGVPDSGSSAILLGMALAGLGIVRRLQRAW
jgi:hypothetical protein